MKYGYYIKIDDNFNLTDALVLLSCQKYDYNRHDFTGVYNKLEHSSDCNYLVIHDGILKPECVNSYELKSYKACHKYWKWTELKLNYKDLGEL